MALVLRARIHIFPTHIASCWLCCRCLLHIFPRHGVPRGLHGWLVGWLAARLLGWLAGWLLGCLAGWLAAWLVGWLAGWPVGWLAGPLAGCLLGWLVAWKVGWLAGRNGRGERRKPKNINTSILIYKKIALTPDRPKAVMLYIPVSSKSTVQKV